MKMRLLGNSNIEVSPLGYGCMGLTHAYGTSLTLEEAADYTGLGLQKLRDISNDENCKFVLWNGRKRLFKRVKLEEYLDKAYSV